MGTLLWIVLVVAFVIAPAWAAARSADPADRHDAGAVAAYAFGGVAVACWSLWLAGQLGLGLLGAALSLLLVAVALIIRAPSLPAPTTLRSALASTPGGVWVAALLMVVAVVVPFAPYGWEGGDGIHRMSMSDWYKHLSVATVLPAALQSGEFPPPNPFLIDASPAPYYYGFHLLAAPFQTAGLDAFTALFGWTLVTAAACPCVLYLVARRLFADPRTAAWAAVGGSLLFGFDLIIWLLHAVDHTVRHWPLDAGLAGLREVVPFTHLDSWVSHNERQLNPPYVTAIWAPHHLAAVLLSLLAIHEVSPERLPQGRVRPLAIVSLAALPALSAYVAAGLGAAVLMSMTAEGWRQRRAPWQTEMWMRWAPTTLLAVGCALPVMWALAGGATATRLTLGVSSAGSVLNGAVFSALLGDGVIARLLDTPMLYLLELGVIGLLALASVRDRVRSGTLTDGQREALFIVGGVLLLVTFVRPPVDGPNNLYARPMLLVWALLAGFAADAWVRHRFHPRWATAGVALCLAGTGLGITAATVEGLWFGPTSAETVRVARWINAHADPQAIVAFAPPNRRFGYWLRRRTVAADRRHALLFGATASHYDWIAERLADAYASSDPAEAHARFTSLEAGVVVVSLPLPVWARPPCFELGFRGPTLAVLTATSRGCARPPAP